MQDTEVYANWLESRRLIISQLAATEASIHELGVRIDAYSEVSREKTLEIANRAEAAIADLRISVAGRELLILFSSGAIGLMTGGLAAAVVEVLVHQLGR